MGTQTEIAKQIITEKADYVPALKANHSTLYSQVKESFDKAQAQQLRSL
ncbi:transposase [Tolypothrix tenuis PCC 7101]|uniref:Transposase n=1 Tax=Tolypothrix tenuis PCC 7101 TaxID=231146 RepID=A0A1Z4NAY6_9CYAN|nr:transposase [Tolypothrix tenuis PCC 7101]BAZ78274.1 transposase [Aulosira laxa NIES-50]